MSSYAHIVSGVVAEIIPPIEGVAIEDRFAPEFIAGLIECDSNVREGWTYDGSVFSEPDGETLGDAKNKSMDAIASQVASLLAAGYPVSSSIHIALDGDTRADLTAMATTAGFAVSGVVEWPDSYSKGWIAIENDRIPLATPQEGIALAAAVGDYYAKIRQYARDLKDAVLAADDEAELSAVPITTGWP